MALKEIKLRPSTGQHDVEIKVKAARRFLEEGNQVKLTVRFRGREIVHQDLAEEKVREIVRSLSDVGQIHGTFHILGKMMSVTVDPRRREQAR